VRQGLAFFGHALSGGGLVVLYIAIYAALHVYALVGPETAFAGMLGVTAEVKLVGRKALERTDGKAKRVVDRRKVE